MENKDLAVRNQKRFFINAVEFAYDDAKIAIIEDTLNNSPNMDKTAANSVADRTLSSCNSLKNSIITFIQRSSGGYKKLNKTTKTKQHRKKSRKTLRK